MMQDFIPISMLNALAYCPRRFGYEYIHSEMLVNEHVFEGSLRHQGVDLGGMAWLGEAVQERRVYVWSERLRIAGICDLVEHKDGLIYPVEYKKGRPGRWQNDHLQLCAQAICLEERMQISIGSGAIFYFSNRRREEVPFSPELRKDLEACVALAHQLAQSQTLAPPLDNPAKCRDCSLEPICLPKELLILNKLAPEE
jgi:CRISPR-associated exonuclease Cas4